MTYNYNNTQEGQNVCDRAGKLRLYCLRLLILASKKIHSRKRERANQKEQTYSVSFSKIID